MSASDVITGVIVLAVAALFLFVYYHASHAIDDRLRLVPKLNETAESMQVLDEQERIISMYDYFVLVIFISICLGVIITSWFVGGHPLFMFIYFLFICFAVLASIFLSNLWEDISSNTIMLTTLPSFPITNNIMLFLPTYAVIIGFIGIVVMFGKPSQLS